MATKKAAKKAPAKPKIKVPSDKALTKGQVMATIAEQTGLSKKEVAGVFDALNGLIAASLSKKGPEQFTVPGLVKLTVKKTKAKKAGMRKNPFTGEMVMGKAKPAQRKVKARALKALNDMA